MNDQIQNARRDYVQLGGHAPRPDVAKRRRSCALCCSHVANSDIRHPVFSFRSAVVIDVEQKEGRF